MININLTSKRWLHIVWNFQVIGNIEVLPNEVLLECFKYLNGVDFLYSFNQLNSRFNQLIQNIPLYLDFQNIEKSIFHMCFHKVLANEEIRRQIYSLKLSNKFTCNQILLFLGFFSFNEFPQLQSLSLIEVKSYDVPPLKWRWKTTFYITIISFTTLGIINTTIGFKINQSVFITD